MAGPIGCPELSVTNYQPAMRNTPEEHRSHVHACGSLKARNSSHISFQDQVITAGKVSLIKIDCKIKLILIIIFFRAQQKNG